MTKEKQHESQKTNRGLYLDLSYIGTLIFLLFRIPLTNIIGNEGNGYFSIAWEVYTLFGLLFGHGIYHITRTMIQTRMRKKQYCNSKISLHFFYNFVLQKYNFFTLLRYLCRH